jgi:predicted metal-binding protein
MFCWSTSLNCGLEFLFNAKSRISMSNKHSIFVCQSCAGVWKNGRQVGNSGGYLLLSELTEKVRDWSLAEEFDVVGVSCMGACNRPCAIAFAAQGKSTYLFGDLSHQESLPELSDSILKCAGLYFQQADGAMSWADRPERLKKGLVGKIPSPV